MSLIQSDVVIIGEELTGWAVGALLAKAGRRVTVLGDPQCVGGKALGPYRVPLNVTLWRMPSSGASLEIFNRL